jgi:DNA-binding transcriptional MerR regulator
VTDRTYTIKETALLTGLSEDTLRYYERLGLVGPVARTASGHRRYVQNDLTWIDLLTKLLATGMPLERVSRYIDLWRQGDGTAEERREMLVTHAQRVEADLSRMQETLAILRWKIQHYDELLQAQNAVMPKNCATDARAPAGQRPRRLNGRAVRRRQLA